MCFCSVVLMSELISLPLTRTVNHNAVFQLVLEKFPEVLTTHHAACTSTRLNFRATSFTFQLWLLSDIAILTLPYTAYYWYS